MSELILKIDADEAGLRAVREATKHLKEVLSSGGLKGSTEDIRALETSLKGLSVQAAATQKEMTGLSGGFRAALVESEKFSRSNVGVIKSLSDLARAGGSATEMLRRQLTQLHEVSAGVDRLSAAQRLLLKQHIAEESVLKALNAEFANQAGILSTIAVKNSEQVAASQAVTQSLLRQKVALGELTAQEAVALGVKDKLIIAEAEYQALLSKGTSARAGYAAQAMAESSAASRLIGAPLSGKSAKGSASVFSEEVSGLSTAYAKLGKEQALALEMNRQFDGVLRASRVSEATSALHNMGIKTKHTAEQTHLLNGAMRGAAGASGSLWLSYGKTAGAVAAMGAAFATVSAAIKGTKLASEFEYATQYAYSLTDAASKAEMPLGVFRDKLLAMKDVIHTPQEMANAVKELVKAGFELPKAVNEMEVLSKMAALAEEPLQKVAAGVVSQYRAWDASRVGSERGMHSLAQTANVMTYAVNKSALGFDELMNMMKYTPQLAGLTNAKFTELNAAMGLMSNLGIKNSGAATSFTNSLMRLHAPTDKAEALLSKYNLSFKAFVQDGERAGKSKGLIEMFGELNRQLGTLTDEAKIEVMRGLFDLRSLKGTSVLQMLDQFKEFSEEVNRAGREMTFLDEQFKGVSETTKILAADVSAGWTRELTKAFSGPAFGQFLKDLKSFIDSGKLGGLLEALAAMTGSLLKLGGLIAEYKDELAAAGKIFVVYKLATWGDAFFTWSKGLKAAAAAQTLFNTAAMKNPYVMIAMGVGAVGGVVIDYTFDKLNAQLDKQETKDRNISAGDRSTIYAEIDRLEQSIVGTKRHIVGQPKNVRDAAEAKIRGWESQQVGVASFLPENRRAGAVAGANLPDTTGASGKNGKRPSAAETAAADKAERLQEWHIQRGLQLEEVARKAKADIREASLKDSLAFADAEHKALLFGDEEYLNKTRKLRQENLQAKLDDAVASEITLSAKVSEAQSFADKNKGSQKAQQDLAKYQDQLTAIQGTVRELNADATAMPKLFELEDVSRLNAAYASLRGIADTARELRENSKIERSIAGMNEADAKKVRDNRKIDLELEKGLQKLFAERKLHQPDGSDTWEAYDLKTLAQEQKVAVQAMYDDEQVRRGDWLAGAEKGFADYAYAASDAFKSTGAIVGRVFENMEDVFINFVKTGKLSFKDLADSLISDMLRIAAKQAVTGIATSVIGALAGSWGDSSTALGGVHMAVANVLHNGTASVGSGSAPSRSVPAALFANAPRFHNGLAPDEFPAILQRGERVSSRSQVAAEKQGGAAPIFNQVFNIDARGAESGLEERLRAAVKEAAAMGYRLVVDEFLRGYGPIAARV